MSICKLPAHKLSQAIHSREISCREVMQATLSRIAQVNPSHNAIVNLRNTDTLLIEADLHDVALSKGQSKGWLHGIPQAIKDLANTSGLSTTKGSQLLKNVSVTNDGLMAERMKASGCIVIGKTNVPEFGLGSHTFNDVFGATRNAFDPSKSAGGSSGGAAVALALNMLSVADGSDFMGSLRNPAGWNNIYGMRPSQGRVPMWPAAESFVSQLATEGPMGRTVQDVALMLQTQSGYDARVPLSINAPFVWDAAVEMNKATAPKLAWFGDLAGYLPMEEGILDICQIGLKKLIEAGCQVEPAVMGFPPEKVWDAWLVWRAALVAANLAPLASDPANRLVMKPEALWEYESAKPLTGQQFMQASNTRSAFYQHLLGLFDHYDFLVLPTAQVWPFELSQRWPKQINGHTMDTYHRWMEVVIYATFAGLPAISVPLGLGAAGAGKGLPAGLQIIGRPQGDLALLRLAAAYEQVAGPLE
jgi:amidase